MQSKGIFNKLLIASVLAAFTAACAQDEPPPPPPQQEVQPPPPPPPPPGPTPGSYEELVEVVGDRVFFDYDSAELDAQDRAKLQEQAQWLNRYTSVRVTVEGHCDERGTRDYNLALGDRRANAVKNYLVALGVSADRIDTISYGKERPEANALCSNESCWSRNRRGVMVVN